MPELPEVETTRRGVAPVLQGRSVSEVNVRDSRLRQPVPPNLSENLVGSRLLGIERRSKYLLLDFGSGSLIVHLGMSGSMRFVAEDTAPNRHDHFDLHTVPNVGDVIIIKLLTESDPPLYKLIVGIGCA